MNSKNRSNVSQEATIRAQSSSGNRVVIPQVSVVRAGQVEPFLDVSPTSSSASANWGGIALEHFTIPAVFIPRHEHPEHFLHVVLNGVVEYEVNTGGRNRRFISSPGRIFLLPRGTVDEVNWAGATRRIAVAIHPRLLTDALEETKHKTDVEMTEQWELNDRHILALLQEMTADLEDSSPAGTLYGESLANSLAVYLLNRYAVRPLSPMKHKGGLPGYRLKRVLEYIAESMEKNISLSQMAGVAGMSPHYFSELFKQSTGRSPHSYVLHQRIELAKQRLRDPRRSIVDAALDAGFQNPSHFARIFRKLVGTTPSNFRKEYLPKMP
ncbi:AraC family transcriptional regulator [Granulicella sp. dw_53]|uniref:helix-turn-helix domain-containing protein n=1 Tax=Granulicella sp. dw_53 TaxID=2719792 RepID=UPI001BD5641A|nr:AraC family transcriptional regulator [Granulicella sp. dw_53]